MAKSSARRSIQQFSDPPLTDAEVIEALSYCKRAEFPSAAVRAVLASPGRFADRLLTEMRKSPQELEAGYDAIEDDDGAYFLDTFATHILVHWRDPRAFDALIAYYSSPGPLASDLTGDFVTERLGAALARLYDGQLVSLKGLIETESAYVFARNAGLAALGCLIVMDKLDEQTVVDYVCAKLDTAIATENADEFTSCLVSFAIDLRSAELRSRIDRCFELDLVDRFWIGPESVEKAYAKAPETRHADFRAMSDFPDVIEEISNFPFFRKPEPTPRLRFLGREGTQSRSLRFGTVILDAKEKCGRNEPCPCGSGKKYKKCCIEESA
mgnify:CR=1 FL=1